MPKAARTRDTEDVEAFIVRDLPKKLKRDLRKLQIVKEADLECSAYFHLRRYLSKDEEWKVLARKYVPWTGRYVDLLLFRGADPVFALELKWAKDEISDKDECSLKSALKDLGAQKAFWICAQPHAGPGGSVRVWR